MTRHDELIRLAHTLAAAREAVALVHGRSKEEIEEKGGCYEIPTLRSSPGWSHPPGYPLVPSSWKAGVLFLRSSLFAGEKVSYKTMVQATIMLLLRAGGVWVSVRNR